MKRFLKLLFAAVLAVVMLSGMLIFSFGETKNGWVTEDGIERYYADGSYVTGVYKIGVHEYVFAENGECLGPYDGYKNPGSVGVMDSASYTEALTGKNLFFKETFDVGREYTYLSGGKYVTADGVKGTSNITFPKEGAKPYLMGVIKKSTFEIVPKNGSTENMAFGYTCATQTVDNYTGGYDSYVNIWLNSGTLHKNSFVIEFEVKLGDDVDFALPLLQFIDRGKSDFNNVLRINKGGFVYSEGIEQLLLCKLDSEQYTRISVAVNLNEDSYDFYCNGVLVKSGITFYRNSAQEATEYNATEIRIMQYGNATLLHGSTYIDNIYIYESDSPVCTEQGEIYSGVRQEGSYLRYYENGVCKTGKFAVSGEFFGQTFDGDYIEFDSVDGAAFIGYSATVKNGDSIVSDGLVKDNLFEAPKSEDIPGKKFLYWKVTDSAGNVSIMLPGEKKRLESNITAEAAGIEVSMLAGASLCTTEGTSALRFMAKISKQDYDAFSAQGITVEPRIIIASTDAVENAHGYLTYDHLVSASSDPVLDIKANDWFTQTENYCYYSATVSDIADLTKNYSAVAYLKITFPDGEVRELYSDYSADDNSRNVKYVAEKAYDDRTTLKNQPTYDEKIKFDGLKTYSPYNKKQMNVIKSFIDRILDLKAGYDGVVANGRFYQSPYSISYTETDVGYDIKITPDEKNWKVTDIGAVYVNGEKYGKEQYSVTDTQCEFSCEVGKVQLGSVSEDDDKDVRSELMISAKTDYNVFSDSVRLPYSYGETGEVPVAPDGSDTAVVWSYSKNGAITLSNSETVKKKFTASNGYMDFSEWKSLAFYVYVPEEYAGATVYVCFYSENPATDGSDYYGKSYTFANAGWNEMIINLKGLGASRTPLGWDKITSVSFTSTGWSQNNDKNTVLYFTDFLLYDQELTESTVVTGLSYDGKAVFAINGYAGSIKGELYPINPLNSDAVSFKEGGTVYLPVSVFAASLDSEALYYEKSSTVIYNFDGKEYVFSEGDCYYLNGEKQKLQKKAVVKNGGLFISKEDAMSIYGYTQSFEDEMGLIVLSNTENVLDSDRDFDLIYKSIQDLMYVRPTGEQILTDLNEHSAGNHPYLMLDGDDFDELQYFVKYEPELRGYLENRAKNYGIGSSKFQSAPNSFSRTDGVRLLSISRDVMEKVITWILLYKFGDYDEAEKQLIFDRIWAEIDAVCNFYDEENGCYSWNPSHFLDVAELAYPMGIAYDWLYDELTEAQRSQMAKAMYELALKQTTVLGGTYNLAGATNNWNGVCNGGIMTAALAIVNDKYIVEQGLQQDVIDVLGASVVAVENGMWVYAPEGGYEEGPGYWSYGTTYVQVLISALDSACGTNYGLYNSPGFEKSAYFTTYLGSGNTTWGFHDGGSGDSNPTIAAWFAKKSGDGNLNAIRRQGIEKGWTGVTVYDIMYYNPHIINNTITLTLDSYYSLDTIMTFRSSWNAENCIFAGLHGGNNQASHGDLDIGNFVICVNGVYMICDLGSDSYNMVGYFGSYRWSYYRKRTEGQNTLVMTYEGRSWDGKTGVPQAIGENGEIYSGALPDPNYYGQDANAVSEGLEFESGTNSAYGVVDMAPAYKSVNGGMKRGLYMTNNRNTVVIQDEAGFSASMDIWWFAHTQGKITILPGEKAAVIYRNGVYLYAEIVTDPNKPIDASFEVMEAVSLDKDYVGDTVESGIYTGETENDRSSYTKLTIVVKGTREYNIAVAFTVIDSIEQVPQLGTIYSYTPMSEWKVD